MSDLSLTSPSLKHELLATLKLAGPLVVAFMGYQTISLVDTFAAGRVGVETLAAVSLGGALYWAITIFPLGVLIGLDPLISQALGRGDERSAWSDCERGLGLALALSAFTLPLLYLLSQPGLPWSTPGTSVSAELLAYTLGRMWSVPALLLHTCLRCFLQAHERTKPILLGTLFANLLNLPLSLYLGGGDRLLVSLGLSPWGWLDVGFGAWGVGLASSVVSSAEVLFLYVITTRLYQKAPRPSHRGWGELFKVGAPIGGSMLSEGGVFSISTLLVSAWSPVVIGAHNVTLQLASYTFILSLGVSNATSVRVGRAVGVLDWRRARLAAVAGLGLSVGIMSLSATTFALKGEALASLISQDTEVISLAGSLLVIAAAFQLFDGAQVVMAAALRGAGFTSTPLWSALVSHWGVGLPLAFALSFWVGLGVHGLWWGLCGGLMCASMLMTTRFHQLSKRALEGERSGVTAERAPGLGEQLKVEGS